jgi:excisionase family DNA binding protein
VEVIRGMKDIRGRYLSTSEAARMLGVSGEWIRQLVKRRALRAVRGPLGYLLLRSSVEAEAERRRRAAEGA